MNKNKEKSFCETMLKMKGTPPFYITSKEIEAIGLSLLFNETIKNDTVISPIEPIDLLNVGVHPSNYEMRLLRKSLDTVLKKSGLCLFPIDNNNFYVTDVICEDLVWENKPTQIREIKVEFNSPSELRWSRGRHNEASSIERISKAGILRDFTGLEDLEGTQPTGRLRMIGVPININGLTIDNIQLEIDGEDYSQKHNTRVLVEAKNKCRLLKIDRQVRLI